MHHENKCLPLDMLKENMGQVGHELVHPGKAKDQVT